MSLCIQANRTDSHFIGSYLVVTLMGGTFDIRVVLAWFPVRPFRGFGTESVGWPCCARCWVLRDRAALLSWFHGGRVGC